MNSYTIQHNHAYGNFGFRNSITVSATSPDEAMQIAKDEVYASFRIQKKHSRRCLDEIKTMEQIIDYATHNY